MGSAPVAAEVEAGAEASALTSEHDDAARRVDRDVVEGVVELADQLGGHRVELVGAVQGDEPHALTRRRDEHGIHGRGTYSAAMSADHVHDAEALPPPTLEEVSDGIFAYVQLDGSWCLNNTGFLVGRDGVTAIDTCATEGRTRAFLAALSSVTPKPVRVLVNTHHHGDHTHGNWLLPAAAVVGHEQCRHEVLTTGSITKGLWPWVEWGEIEVWPPFVTFDDHLSVWVDDLEVSLQHIGPAHTTNDVVGWVADRSVLFTGDLVFNGGTPFVVMGSVAGSLESVEQLRAFGARDDRARPRLGVRSRGVRSARLGTSSSCSGSLATPRPPVRPRSTPRCRPTSASSPSGTTASASSATCIVRTQSSTARSPARRST